jgi:hypothetical protein
VDAVTHRIVLRDVRGGQRDDVRDLGFSQSKDNADIWICERSSAKAIRFLINACKKLGIRGRAFRI